MTGFIRRCQPHNSATQSYYSLMFRSLNEIELTARKATRGCGLPWGIADETGKAIRWLHIFGLDGVSGLLSVLEQYRHQAPIDYAPQSLQGIWCARTGTLNPLLSGVSLCDCIGLLQHRTIETAKIGYPLLTAGFLGNSLLGNTLAESLLGQNQSIQLKWSGVTLELQQNQLAVRGNKDDLEIKVSEQLICQRITLASDTEQRQMLIGDVMVDDKCWKKLEEYAFNIYVETTEASRISGAGAGLNDND